MASADRPTTVTLDEVEARLAVVVRRLTAVAGGASLCVISRAGGSVDGAKHLEGRMAVLSELKRGARSQPVVPLANVAKPIAEQWRADLERQKQRDAAAGWVAYRAGGVDELDELFGHFDEVAGARS